MSIEQEQALETAIARGVRQVEFADQRIRYDSIEAMERVLARMRHARLRNDKGGEFFRVRTRKGTGEGSTRRS